MSTNGADYNIFGYDPDGRIASLAAFFYGPAWKPVNHNPIPPCVQLEGAPPRYGPPAPEQLPFLSPNFIPRLPPCYLGSPDPPYRAGSETFTRGNFAAVLLRSIEDQVPWELGSDLEKQYGRRILDGLPIGEVKDGGMLILMSILSKLNLRFVLVFWVPVYSVLESKADRVEFGIMSDISWWSFREMVCKHMGVEPTRAKLAYRLYVEGHAEVDPKGMIDATDLDQVMKEVGRRFEHCNDVEIELMNINNSVSFKSILQERSLLTIV
jgi:hypothetical protein